MGPVLRMSVVIFVGGLIASTAVAAAITAGHLEANKTTAVVAIAATSLATGYAAYRWGR